MPEVDINRIISVTQARANIASLVDDVIRTKKFYVLTRGGRPAVMLSPINTNQTIIKKNSNLPKFDDEDDSIMDLKSPLGDFKTDKNDKKIASKPQDIEENEENEDDQEDVMPKIDLSQLDEALDSYEKSQATKSE